MVVVSDSGEKDLRDFYCIQRLKRTGCEIASDARFGQVFELDYMGYAEYEFGSFSKYLRAAHAQLDHLVEMRAAISDGNDQGHMCAVVCFYDPQSTTWEHIERQLTLLANGQLETLGSTRFAEPDQVLPPTSKRSKKPPVARRTNPVCAWVDIGQNVFWATCEISLEQYKSMLSNSMAYMSAVQTRT